MLDFMSAGYIGMPGFIFDFLERYINSKWLLLISNWWSWVLAACVLYGFWWVYGGMVDKVAVLGGGLNKWSPEARKWKWKIFAGFLLIHSNYLLVAFAKFVYAVVIHPAGVTAAASL